ncbi:MAG: c-type cytochrome [Pseudomonadota bacterium]
MTIIRTYTKYAFEKASVLFKTLLKALQLSIVSALLLSLAPIANTAEILRGDAAIGEQKAVTCVACHGMDGNSLVPTFPKLAGLGEKYLLQQMQHIRDGLRPVPAMVGQVDNMSDQELADIAAYFNQLDRTRQSANPELIALGSKVYRAGVAERNVSACIACHGATGNGNSPAGFPAIGGQHAEYIAAQLVSYRKGYEDPTGRVTDGDIKIMRSNAFGLSDREIEAVSAYISGLQ